MRTIVIVQARQGSSRLPGKSTMPFQGRSSLLHLLDSVSQVFSRESIYVATSAAPENDLIRKVGGSYGVRVVSGDEHNVASRFVTILRQGPPASYFFRICGDSPLYDYRILARGIKIAAEASARPQVVSSMPNRGYPQGMNLEMIECETYLEAYPRFTKPEHFEHVTGFLYDNLDQFDSVPVECGLPDYSYGRYKFSVDTADDARRIAGIVARMDRPHFHYSLAEKCRLYDQVRELEVASTISHASEEKLR